MDAREALERRIDELCAENERLRLRHEGYVVDLQEALAENAKLRELLADMFRDFVRCDIALREHGRTYLAYTRYIDRMRELGIIKEA